MKLGLQTVQQPLNQPLTLTSTLYHQVPDGSWLSLLPRVGGVDLDILKLSWFSVLHSMDFLTPNEHPVHVPFTFQGLGNLYISPHTHRRLVRKVAIVFVSTDS